MHAFLSDEQKNLSIRARGNNMIILLFSAVYHSRCKPLKRPVPLYPKLCLQNKGRLLEGLILVSASAAIELTCATLPLTATALRPQPDPGTISRPSVVHGNSDRVQVCSLFLPQNII